jgi:beta-phosphoglucomutase
MTLPAFLFDLNGTMINDMPYHIKAWHSIFNNLGAGISMKRMKSESYGKNSEVIERIMPGRFSAEEKKAMSRAKEMQYQKEFKPHLKLLPGLDTFLHDAHQSGIKMAIGSAAIMYNIDFVLDGLSIRNYFSAIVSADDVVISKPNPETFLKCATLLGAEPDQCVVFEDAPKGVEAAQNAGMKCVVLTTIHTVDEFYDYKNIISYCADYRELNPSDLNSALVK